MSRVANVEAASAIPAHHLKLHEHLRTRGTALQDAVRSGRDDVVARDAVIRYLHRDLLPHAAAEETALYPAGDAGTTAMLARAMRDEHRGLVGSVGDLSKENDLLLPAIVVRPDVSLLDLLGATYELVG